MKKYIGITKLAKEAIECFDKKWKQEQKRKNENSKWEKKFISFKELISKK